MKQRAHLRALFGSSPGWTRTNNPPVNRQPALEQPGSRASFHAPFGALRCAQVSSGGYQIRYQILALRLSSRGFGSVVRSENTAASNPVQPHRSFCPGERRRRGRLARRCRKQRSRGRGDRGPLRGPERLRERRAGPRTARGQRARRGRIAAVAGTFLLAGRAVGRVPQRAAGPWPARKLGR
jgi:hypothetical protein